MAYRAIMSYYYLHLHWLYVGVVLLMNIIFCLDKREARDSGEFPPLLETVLEGFILSMMTIENACIAAYPWNDQEYPLVTDELH